MSDNKPKDDREELNVTAYCNELKDLKKNYKLYTNENKYSFSQDGSKLKHDLSIEGEKIVKEPTKGRGPKKDKDFNDLYNRLKNELTVYIDEKFDVFEQKNNKKHDESKQQIINLEERLNKKIDDRFDELLKAIKEKK
ncbi:hypothetical protein ACA758_04035 [Mycoplasmopsis agassizii]|uniref:hypothetical protein n=1 Tax=Mycoplasmopsis agassizii TaxID=33922 RepID=UPI003526EF25